MLHTWKQQALRLKVEIYALYLAYRDPTVSWYARLFVGLLVAYAFSPIDLIPDFIPIFGYLDDLILLPLGIMIAIKLIPPTVLAECREQARLVMQQERPANRVVAALIVSLWAFLLIFGIIFAARLI